MSLVVYEQGCGVPVSGFREGKERKLFTTDSTNTRLVFVGFSWDVDLALEVLHAVYNPKGNLLISEIERVKAELSNRGRP